MPWQHIRVNVTLNSTSTEEKGNDLFVYTKTSSGI